MKHDNIRPEYQSNISHYIHLLARDDAVCEQAIEALIQTGISAIPALIAALQDPERWFAAAQALTSIGQPAIAPLIAVMREERLGNFAFHALMNMGATAVPAFIAALKDPDAEVRMWAATAFELMPDSRAYAALVDTINDPDVIVRRTVIQALGKIGDSHTVSVLTEVSLHDSDGETRHVATEAIRAIRLHTQAQNTS